VISADNKNFIIKIWEMLKADGQTKIGMFLIATGATMLASMNFVFTINKIKIDEVAIDSLDFTISDSSYTLVSFVFLIIGLGMLTLKYYSYYKEYVILYYSKGIPNMSDDIPYEALPKSEKLNARGVILHKNIDSYNKNDVKNGYAYINQVFNNKTYHQNAKKVYISSFASFPYLFLLGSGLRNAHAKSEVLEYNRQENSGKWTRLKEFSDKEITHSLIGDNCTIDAKINDIKSKEIDDIGIALSYSFPIEKSILPKEFQDTTLILSHSLGTGIESLSCKPHQEKLCKELVNIIAKLSSDKKRNIHLFVSAQASMCINIGKIYMDNAHGTLFLYNFDNSNKTYNWSIKFHKGELV